MLRQAGYWLFFAFSHSYWEMASLNPKDAPAIPVPTSGNWQVTKLGGNGSLKRNIDKLLTNLWYITDIFILVEKLVIHTGLFLVDTRVYAI